MALNFRLFNCDRTFNLDSVEALIRKVTTKVSRETKIEKSYFPLPRMSELCKELEEGGSHFDYAVFVVHAHESRLSINEKNAGIGYAKLYCVLQKVSDDRVLIVIGGDDNYKDEGERDKSVLSRWAWHKICSQFTEGYLNGAKSFIFSWEDSHNPIHEEALEFYLDPENKGQEFVPRPKPPPPARVEPKKLEQSQYDTSHEKKQDLQTIGNMGDPLNAKQMQEPQAIALVRTDNAGPLQDESSAIASGPTHQAARGDKTSDLYILSFHSSDESVKVVGRILQDVVSKHQAIPSKPFILHLTNPDMLKYITTYKPKYLILVSEMDNFQDLPNLDNQVKLYQDLVKNSQDVGTKLIFVIGEDDTYKEGDISSSEVQSIFTRLNKGIPKTDKLIMSWDKTPSSIHIEALAQLLSPCKDERVESLQCGKPDPTSICHEYKREKRCKVLISNGLVVKVLESDPPGWEPKTPILHDVVDKYKERKDVLVECLEEGNGIIVKEVQARLFKIYEETGIDGKPSVLVYCYYSKEETVKTMNDFIHWLDVPALLEPQTMELQHMITDIMSSKPDYVVLSADIEVFQDLDEVKVVMRNYESYMKRVESCIGQRIILMLLGDTSYKKGEMVSEKVKVVVDELTKGILNPDKLMVMSWETRPYTTHQEWMKEHLNPKGVQLKTYVSEKGQLRFKANISKGRIVKGLAWCNPLDWRPKEYMLMDILDKCKTEEKAMLEFWENNGNINPVITTPSKGWFSSQFSCPSFQSFPFPFRSPNKKKDKKDNDGYGSEV